MNTSEKALAVLMQPMEVASIFSEWPEEMCLAVCLMPQGDCQMVVFRIEEYATIMPRLVRYLTLDAQEISVLPVIDGYPTRRLTYTDERRLMALVAASPAVVEEAEDYSGNYNYAVEEGMDPAEILGLSRLQAGAGRADDEDESVARETAEAPRAAAAGGRSGDTAPQGGGSKPRPALGLSLRLPSVRKARLHLVMPETEPTKPDTARSDATDTTSRKGADAKGLPSFLRRDEDPSPGAGFRSAQQIAEDEAARALCEVRVEDTRWIIVDRPGAKGGELRLPNPDKVYLSDDRKVAAIALAPHWPADGPLPARLMIAEQHLPKPLQQIFASQAGPARLSVKGGYLYVHFTEPDHGPGPGFSLVSDQTDAVLPATPDALTVPTPKADPATVLSASKSHAVPAAVAPAPAAPARKPGRRGWFLAWSSVAAILALAVLGLQIAQLTGGDDRAGPEGENRYRVSSFLGSNG